MSSDMDDFTGKIDKDHKDLKSSSFGLTVDPLPKGAYEHMVKPSAKGGSSSGLSAKPIDGIAKMVCEAIQKDGTCPKHKEETKYRAPFIWPSDVDSVEEAGYEFANANTEEYRKMWWERLKERILASSGSLKKEDQAVKSSLAGAEKPRLSTEDRKSLARKLRRYAFLVRGGGYVLVSMHPEAMPPYQLCLDRGGKWGSLSSMKEPFATEDEAWDHILDDFNSHSKTPPWTAAPAKTETDSKSDLSKSNLDECTRRFTDTCTRIEKAAKQSGFVHKGPEDAAKEVSHAKTETDIKSELKECTDSNKRIKSGRERGFDVVAHGGGFVVTYGGTAIGTCVKDYLGKDGKWRTDLDGITTFSAYHEAWDAVPEMCSSKPGEWTSRSLMSESSSKSDTKTLSDFSEASSTDFFVKRFGQEWLIVSKLPWGGVLYLDKDGEWTGSLSKSKRFETSEEAQAALDKFKEAKKFMDTFAKIDTRSELKKRGYDVSTLCKGFIASKRSMSDRDPITYLYSGRDMVWHSFTMGLEPFLTEDEAWDAAMRNLERETLNAEIKAHGIKETPEQDTNSSSNVRLEGDRRSAATTKEMRDNLCLSGALIKPSGKGFVIVVNGKRPYLGKNGDWRDHERAAKPFDTVTEAIAAVNKEASYA